MRPSSRTNLFLQISILFSIFTFATSINFHFSSFNLRDFTLLGDSYIQDGIIGLTKQATYSSTSSGAFIYKNPIQFFDYDTNITASFACNFSFAIHKVAHFSHSGDGLTFFLTQDYKTIGTPGGYLGLVNSSEVTKNEFIAVEFDTKFDPYFNDPNDNHVGLNVNGLVSVQTSDLLSKGVDVRRDGWVYVWVHYFNEKKLVQVYMSHTYSKPRDTILEVAIDLSKYLKEFMYVGFSGSAEGGTEIHGIGSFGFQTFRSLPRRPLHRPNNATGIDVNVPPSPSVKKGGQKRTGLGFAVTGSLFCCVILVFLGVFAVKKLSMIKKQRSFKAERVSCRRQFSYGELELATKGFHSSRVVGSGAFGTVYKAYFKGSEVAAVKRLKHSQEGKTEFLAELSIVASLKHKNLIQLHGWCMEKGEFFLVFEYMPNGSLDTVLYPDSKNAKPLPWPQRYNIAVDLASVLTYLHEECGQKVIHRDIKTSNVMLDVNFKARLGDFGLARVIEHGKTPLSTLTAGTMGYLAPEYLHYGIATEKTDVFSYGVVVLEVACGRQPIRQENDDPNMVNLVDWVWGLHSEGRLMEAADPKLKRKFDEKQMKTLLLVGLSCTNPDCSGRPNMRRVLQMLNNEAHPVIPKSKPTLSFSTGIPLSIEDIFSEDKEDNCMSSEISFQDAQSLQSFKEIL